MQRLIFHIDVNSAFLSWEATRRVANGQEDLRNIPSAVGGDREKRTGVILAKSIPAKRFGVTTGEPVAAALRKCPSLVLVPADFALYQKCSHALVSICREYTPVVEQFSIDECFLDMTGTERLYPDPIQIAYEIKNRIKKELGFTVNIGISSNKLLAKMASDFEKPDKIHTLFPNEIQAKMWNLPAGDLFSVGKNSAEKLQKAYIRTIGDIAHSDVSFLQHILGKKFGQKVWEYANGIDPSPVLPEPEKAKGYSISTTLPEDITSFSSALSVLLSLSEHVSRRMRRDHAKACCIAVNIRSKTFDDKSHQKKLSVPTDVTKEIFEISKVLLNEMWAKRYPLRLLGISLTDIVYGEEIQMSLFGEERKTKERHLDKALDGIRDKYGEQMIVRGRLLNTDIEIVDKKKYK